MLGKQQPLALASTSLNASVPAQISEKMKLSLIGELPAQINKELDSSKPSRFYSWQGLTTRQSVTQARKPWFFCTLFRVLIFGRGGTSSIKYPFRERLVHRSLAVTNTPIALVGNHLVEIKGAHTHA
ncbi:MAG: hypothetical protein R8M45_11525 [Ghiorsea sp.]